MTIGEEGTVPSSGILTLLELMAIFVSLFPEIVPVLYTHHSAKGYSPTSKLVDIIS